MGKKFLIEVFIYGKKNFSPKEDEFMGRFVYAPSAPPPHTHLHTPPTPCISHQHMALWGHHMASM